MGDFAGTSLASAAAVVLVAIMSAVAAVWAMVLISEDVTQRRLPDLLTLPAAGIAVAVCCVEPRGWAGLIWPAMYVMAGPGFGGGDVKLAVSLGIMLAVTGGVGAVLAGMLLASCFTVFFLLFSRQKIAPHGPSMLASAWMVGFASAFVPGV